MSDLTTRLHIARQRADQLCAHGEQLREQARRVLGHDPDGFTVVGTLDDRPVRVRWHRGRLHADPQTLDRVRLVVELAHPGAPGPVPALTGERTQVLLAVLRALDRVHAVQLALAQDATADGWQPAASTELDPEQRQA